MTNLNTGLAAMATALAELEQQLAAEKEKSQRLERENDLYRRSHEEHLGIDPSLSPYHQMRATEPLGKRLQELKDLEERAVANGFKSLRYLVYSSEKTERFEYIPEFFRYAPAHWISKDRIEKTHVIKNGHSNEKVRTIKGVNALQAQNQLKRLFPLLNDLLNDPSLTAGDLEDLRNEFQTLSFEDFAALLHGIKTGDVGHTAVNVLSAAVVEVPALPMTEKEQEALQQRLDHTAKKKKSGIEDPFENLNQPEPVVVPRVSTPDPEMAQKQLDDLSDEDLELFNTISTLG